MKKTFLILLLMVAVKGYGQVGNQKLDSLSSLRTSTSFVWGDAFGKEVSTAIIFSGFTVNDSFKVCSIADSIIAPNGKSYARDTIPAFYTNMSTGLTYDSGWVVGFTSPLKILLSDKNIQRLLIKTTDVTLSGQISIRVYDIKQP